MELSDKAKVWNRAALESGGDAPLEGDIALAALLAVHGMIMNGGVDHALEVLDSGELMAGIAGLRYFGLSEAASVLEAATVADIGLKLLSTKYGALIPEDSTLFSAFEDKYVASPDVFSPLEYKQCPTTEWSARDSGLTQALVFRMNTHPKTLEYIGRILGAPDMFIPNFDVSRIETLLYGFEAGLSAAGVLEHRLLFNREFTDFVSDRRNVSGSLGWARALIDEFGLGRNSYDAFCELIRAAFPSEFSSLKTASCGRLTTA